MWVSEKAVEKEGTQCSICQSLRCLFFYNTCFSVPGIHWHAGCQKGSDSGQKYVDVLSSIRAILTQAQHCKAKRKHSSGSGKRAREEEAEETVEGEGVSRTLSEQELGDRRRGATKFPLLIWRETLPQHFPSSNGGYPLNQRFVGQWEG